jgi:hypothetical protein
LAAADGASSKTTVLSPSEIAARFLIEGAVTPLVKMIDDSMGSAKSKTQAAGAICNMCKASPECRYVCVCIYICMYVCMHWSE